MRHIYSTFNIRFYLYGIRFEIDRVCLLCLILPCIFTISRGTIRFIGFSIVNSMPTARGSRFDDRGESRMFLGVTPVSAWSMSVFVSRMSAVASEAEVTRCYCKKYLYHLEYSGRFRYVFNKSLIF